MKIVILGAAGQLGWQLARTLPGEIVALARNDGDLTRPAELRQTLDAIRPDVVANAAAFTQVDRAEARAAEAFAINTLGVGDLATLCRDVDATLIHFSTNYVFGADEGRATPYRETDPPGPISVYGNSKLAGDYFVQAICPKHFIVRTCGLYGLGAAATQRSNFVETMLRQAERVQSVRVVSDQICTPTSAADLAQATAQLLQGRDYGLYHVTNAGACSWHEFAQAIFELAKKPMRVEAISGDEYAAPARRPRYSVLDNGRWIERGYAALRPWREALADYLAARGG